MTFKHGVYVEERSGSPASINSADSAIPFVVGTASGVGANGNLPVNEPKLISSFNEYQATFGYVGAREATSNTKVKGFVFSLDEFAKAYFSLYNAKPAIIVNVLDPTNNSNKTSGTRVSTGLKFDTRTGRAVFDDYQAIASSIVISTPGAEGEDPITFSVANGDLLLIHENGGYYLQSTLNSSNLFKVDTSKTYSVTYSIVISSAITSAEIIGSYNSTTGKRTGLELIKEVFPRFRVIPSLIVVPKYCQINAVAIKMQTLANGISDLFKAVALIDLPAGSVTVGGSTIAGPAEYTSVPTFKAQSTLDDRQAILTWPCVNYSGELYGGSSHLAGIIAETDAAHDGVPFVSPSNKRIYCSGLCDSNGAGIWLDATQANYLNSQGVNTTQNWLTAWKYWGNSTACYPENNTVKDYFIPIRRMFGWISNSLVINYFSEIDSATTRRKIESIIDRANIWFNSLKAGGYIVGGRVEFNSDENPLEDMAAGHYRFHAYATPPSPLQAMDWIIEYDISYLNELYG